MTKIEKYLKLPNPMTPKDEEAFEELDVVESVTEWVGTVSKQRMYHKTTIEWNAPRRPSVLHPSSVDNSCDFFLYLQIVGGEGKDTTSENTRVIFDTGTAIHAQMQYYMETRAKVNKYKYKAEVGFGPSNANAKKLKMAGHIDGVSIGWPLSVPIVWEYKTINKNRFERLTSAHVGYVKQVHLYMLAVGAPAAIILYICKDNSQFKAYKVPFTESVWRPLLKRLIFIRESAKTLKDPERKISAGCRRCRFLEECAPDLSGIKRSRFR